MRSLRLVLLGFTGGIVTTAFACGVNTRNLTLSMFFLIAAIIADYVCEMEREKDE